MNTRKVTLLGVMCKVKIYQEGGCHIKVTGVAKFNLLKLHVKKFNISQSIDTVLKVCEVADHFRNKSYTSLTVL